MKRLSFLFVFLVALSFLPSLAGAVIVPGTSDPWLAGMPNGSTASSGDVAPDESPVLVTGLTLTTGTVLTFAVTGSVNNVPSPSGLTPDGGTFWPHLDGVQNGISNINAPINSLLGIFLGPNQPNLSTAPGTIDFSSYGLNFSTLSPQLQQVFFIGDGLTGTGTGTVQQFVVPSGATRLFLGTMDGFGWYNNFGMFEVTVNPTVPVPGALLLFAPGLVGLAAIRRRFKK